MTMKKELQSVSSLCLLLAALVTTPSTLGAAGGSVDERVDPLTLEGPPYWVRVPHQTECCPKTIELRVREEGSRGESSLALSGRMERLQELRPVTPPRLLLVGDLRYGGTNLWVVNLETLKQEAEIWTYGYGLSPSRRYLAYQTHYPPRALPGGRRSIFLLYDLSLPPEKNRPGPPSEWPEPNLGTPIFPEEHASKPSWDVREAKRLYSLSSPFLWSEDERELVFVVVGLPPEGEERSSSIVRVTLGPDGQVRDVVTEALSSENLEAPGSRITLDDRREPHLVVTLDTLEWADEKGKGWLVGETALPGDELGSKVWIRLPKSGSEPGPERP